MKYCFGVDIGGTTVKMGLFEESGTILDKWEITTDTSEEGKAVLPNIAASIEKKIEEHKLDKNDIAGIGAGVPAPVTAEGIVNGSANLGWKYKEVKKELEELTGLTSYIANDANVAALGEMWKGGGEGEKNMIMVTLGTGVGGGIIIDGKMLVGANGAGGEIGHLCVNYDETDRCGCGGIIKPDVVLYEEGLDQGTLEASVRALAEADMLIIGGTSLNVYPAAGLIRYYQGHKLVLLNKSPVARDLAADLVITDPIGETLAQL